MAPLPRAYQWADGSAYVNHVELVRKARGAEMPESFWKDPLMYQGASDELLGPHDDIVCPSEDFGIDFEAEVAVITDDVPMGTRRADADGHIRLLMLVNDVSLRNLIPAELAKGFGFFQSKPATGCSPVAVTPDELGEAWKDGKVHLPLVVHWNQVKVGEPNAGDDMTFDFPQLIAHVAKTRNARAGSIIGSGTVSNLDRSRGYCCIAEKRSLEMIESGSRDDAVHEVRRHRPHRDVRRSRPLDLRRHRAKGCAACPALADCGQRGDDHEKQGTRRRPAVRQHDGRQLRPDEARCGAWPACRGCPTPATSRRWRCACRSNCRAWSRRRWT